MDVIDLGPNSHNRRKVLYQRHPCDRMDGLAIRKHRHTPASTSHHWFDQNRICVNFIVYYFEGLLWIRTLRAFHATSLVVRACRKNGTHRWTPRTRTLIKGIRNSGRLLFYFFPRFVLSSPKRKRTTIITQLNVYGTLYGFIQYNFVFVFHSI